MPVRLQHFTDLDERPHVKTDNAAWQESVLMHWYDVTAGIGGLQRIGHEPNRDGGKAVLWSNVFTTDGMRYRRCLSDLALRPVDQFAEGFGALDHRFVFDDSPRWTIRDEGIAVDLQVRNIFPILDVIHDDMGSLSRSFAANHFEAAGEITGEARVNDRTIPIHGFCYRDHSWGVRDWSAALLTHRWFTGTFGPPLSFGLTTWHDAEGQLSCFGFVVREQQVSYTQNFDVVVFMEADGITHRGAELTLVVDGGDTYHITCKAVDGAVFIRGAIACVDIICEAECRGMKGYCDGEISTNPRLGTAPITLAIRADIGDGLRFSTDSAPR